MPGEMHRLRGILITVPGKCQLYALALISRLGASFDRWFLTSPTMLRDLTLALECA